ncbi:MAG: helix-turn-helix transcriptional regulator [Burkholderiaceae bacterium]
MDSISIESLKADVQSALANKQTAPIGQWTANKAKHQEEACQLLRIRDVSKLTTLSKSCIQLWVAQGRFPKPLTISTTVKVWRLSQINDWLNAIEVEAAA